MGNINGENTLKFILHGEGSPVLLLHGWGCNIQTMMPVADYLKKIGKQAIVVDFPGHGGSSEPDIAWGVEDFKNQIVMLLAVLKVLNVDIVAHSFGGRVAIMLASEHPELVKNLVLTGSAGVLPKRKIGYYIKIYKHKIGKFLARFAFFDRLFNLKERSKNAGSEDYKKLSNNMKGTFIKVVNQDLTPYLQHINAPTLLVWGELDAETPLYMANIIKDSIKDCALITFEGSGHFAYLEQLNRFCAIIGSFFGG